MTRLKDRVHRVSGRSKPPKWMRGDLHTLIRERPNDEKFKRRSQTASANRKSGADEKGKAPATHLMGRRNAVQMMDEIEKEKNEPPTAIDLFQKSKKHPKKGYVTKRAAKMMDLLTEKRKEKESQQKGPVDDDELFFETHNGFDKKGRMYGLGSAAIHLYEPSRASTGSFTTSNARLRAENAELREQQKKMKEEQKQKMKAYEAFMTQVSQKLGIDFDPNFNPDKQGTTNDDDDDDDDGTSNDNA